MTSKSKDPLGDRMKAYEARETSGRFLPLIPIYARIDGRGFSRFTKGFDRPNDTRLRALMIETTKQMVRETNARVGYTQSDEISLAWQYDDIKSNMHFDGRKFKLIAGLAADATQIFNRLLIKSGDKFLIEKWEECPRFDARVLNIPTITECANMFIWREKDATKNALQMAARSQYSHRQLMGKNSSQINEMLFQKGINFNDYPAEFKRGTYVRKVTTNRELTEEEKLKIPLKYRDHEDHNRMVRSEIVSLDMPPFSRVENFSDVLFYGCVPVLHADNPIQKDLPYDL